MTTTTSADVDLIRARDGRGYGEVVTDRPP
jgi:hypothetical protein